MSRSSFKFAPVNAEGVVADLDMPATAYRALLKMRALSEHGGRIEIEQSSLAQQLGISRPAVTAALRTLDLAQLVKKERNGVYRINAMLAGYATPADALEAVRAMPDEERLTDPDFVSRYHRAVDAYRDQLAEKRRKREHQKRRETLKAVS